jgi:hypothetical protein
VKEAGGFFGHITHELKEGISSQVEGIVDESSSHVEELSAILQRKLNFKLQIFGVEKRHEVPLEHIETQEHSCAAMYVVHPRCRLCKGWDICSLVFIYLNAMLIPFVISFDVEESNFWMIVNVLVDLFFILDIVFVFFRAYEEDGVLVCRPGAIAKRYIGRWHAPGWFWADLLASFPYQWVFLIVEATQEHSLSSGIVSYLKLMRLARLLRLIKSGATFDMLEEMSSDHAAQFRIVRLIFLLTTIAHFCGCTWFLVSRHS